MDLKKFEEGIDGESGVKKSESRSVGSSPKNSSGQLSGFGSKSKELGNMSKKEMFLRADKIDFKSWDVQLDKHLSRVWSRDRDNKDANTKREEWEIDLAKLDIRNVIAHSTYGTVYRGVYDGQDVAGKDFFMFINGCFVAFKVLVFVGIEYTDFFMVVIIFILNFKFQFFVAIQLAELLCDDMIMW